MAGTVRKRSPIIPQWDGWDRAEAIPLHFTSCELSSLRETLWPSDLTGRAEVGGQGRKAQGPSSTDSPSSVGSYLGDTFSRLV